MEYIRWFDEIGKSEIGLVGGKGANLGELTQAGLPVPTGFCVTSAAYQEFLLRTGLDQLISNTIAAIRLDDLDDIQSKSGLIQSAILSAPIFPEIKDEVSTCYQQLLIEVSQDIPLAVRSSATAEDQANASFAGQLETYLNIRGIPVLLEHIKLCWASLWAQRVVSYIANQGLDHRSVSMSVVVQTMIPSEVSGVLFTVNPVSGRRDEIVINSSWGLGEAIVSGLVTPDTIIARKSDGGIINRQIGVKELMVATLRMEGQRNCQFRMNYAAYYLCQTSRLPGLLYWQTASRAIMENPRILSGDITTESGTCSNRGRSPPWQRDQRISIPPANSTAQCLLKSSRSPCRLRFCPSLSPYSRKCWISRSGRWVSSHQKISRQLVGFTTSPTSTAIISPLPMDRFHLLCASR
jgi:hypothetical protein